MTSIKRRNTLKFLCAAAAMPLVAGCDDALPTDTDAPQALQTPDALGDFLREDVERRMRKAGVTGLSIALVDDQQLPWYFASGWADKENNIPAKPQTQYRAGSISKLFTVAAALQFAAQGKLDLDAPIQAVLPEFGIRSRFGAAPITARLLMTHRAGLPRDVLGGMFMDQPQPFDAMVRRLRDAELICPPGLLMSYSNVGLTVLGAAVQRLAGVPFEVHLQRSLLQPLGMAQAGFAVHPADAPDMAAAHDKAGLAHETGLRDVPAGGLNASVLDLARFLSMVFAEGRAGDAQVLPAAWVREMLRPQLAGGAEALPSQRTGLGWMLDDAPDLPPHAGPLAHHAGATLYHRAYVATLPRYRLGVAVASNDARATKLLRELAHRALRLALQAKTGLRQEAGASATAAPAEVPLSGQELAAYAGRYTTEVGLVQVRPDGSRLLAQALGQRFQLRADAQGWLHPRYALLGLIPLNLADLDKLALQRRHVGGRDVLVVRTEGKELLLGERLAPPPADAPRWTGVAGRYVPLLQPGEAALVEQVDVFEEDGLLLARVKLPARYGDAQTVGVVQPLSETEARTPGPLAGMGEVVRRCEVEGRPGFEVAGLRFKQVQT
ncbi:serine hydrolase domain-containing protein [Azohydromonas lata]|uniref:Serine hydrolase domain-containing protein n=1 Tax=Azohydromonas lata TaxID=45677 RepID=A0ABU5INS0_9BURK|nr:serine hydrolase domain-containing protein [Azohydromonas lata]MDZ5460545.1 serine hydrolase domain-containing protein [Azohydromonas lata]